MVPLKRKRHHQTKATGSSSSSPLQPLQTSKSTFKPRSASTAAGTRRATRQTSDAAPPPIPWAADPEPRRRRKSTVAVDAPRDGENELDDRDDDGDDEHEDDDRVDEDEQPAKPPERKAFLRNANSGRAVSVGTGTKRGTRQQPEQRRRPVLQTTNQADPDMVPKPVIRDRALRRHSRYDENDPHPAQQLRNGDTNGPVVAPKPFEWPPVPLRRRRPAADPPPQPPPPPPPPKLISRPHHETASSKIVPIMAQAPPRSVTIVDHAAANTSKPVLPGPALSTVPSPPRPAKKQIPVKQHPDHRRPGVIERNIDKVVFGNVCFSTWYHSPYGTEALEDISGYVKANGVGGAKDGGSKEEALSNPNRRTKEERLDRLYVCPSCFKYSKELVPWWQHVHQCETRGYVPGRKIYTHPKGRRASQQAASAALLPKGTGRKRKASDAAPMSIEDDIEDQGEWSIWEVDGEEEGLFCQNLSLFAKLFLDNKSVFFDVTGFKYFLLVHTTPRPPTENGETLLPKRQVVGFFSKEKLSWDNNNLACILVFPPWQRKGLGALLMGISYEISRREGMLGGPEKPISDLGKKGYKRFWAGEIAAWLLGLNTMSGGDGGGEAVVDVDECSKATWILPEDCLLVLREMGVVEEAEAGPPPKKKKRVAADVAPAGEGGEAVDMEEEVEEEVVQNVLRVRVSKQAVWHWVRANRIPLEAACDPEGFVEGYAVKRTGVEEQDEV